MTSAEIFSALSLAPSASHDAIEDMLAERRVAFASIEVLAPRIARLLSMRSVLGVRNSTHTLVKILQPFAPAGLRLVNYTHPPYRDSWRNCSATIRMPRSAARCWHAAPRAKPLPTRGARCRSTGCTTAYATR